MATNQYTFTVNIADLEFILKQIVVAEREAAGETLQEILGTNAAILPYGLRHVDGSNNNLLPGGELIGAADTIFPRITEPDYINDTGSGAFGPVTNNNYENSGSVVDSAPRTISNLVVNQTADNPAAIAAMYANPISAAAFQAKVDAWFADEANLTAFQTQFGRLPTPADIGADLVDLLGNPVPHFLIEDADVANIANQSPDIGLSPSFNSWMTFFGQFFDHGLDLVPKGGNGTVYIPLQPDDPLYVEGSPTNFMALTRASTAQLPGTDGILGTADDVFVAQESVNRTTPWIDQNQTYSSHSSKQVFMREYAFTVDSDDDGIPDSHAVSTGKLLEGANGGLATWADVKAQALEKLGIVLTDTDVFDVPLLATDAYGRFIPGSNGYALIATPDGFVQGTAEGIAIPENAYRTGHAFLDDIAHNAVPGTVFNNISFF